LKMYCSEFHQWLIHFNTHKSVIYWPYSLTIRTLFDVLRNMIVLQAAQVLHQSSSGTTGRRATRLSRGCDECSSSTYRTTFFVTFCFVFHIFKVIRTEERWAPMWPQARSASWSRTVHLP
jgi:hypothetical protein